MPFVPSVLGEDMAGATDDGIMTPEGYQEYCRRVEESGDWGGEIEVRGGVMKKKKSNRFMANKPRSLSHLFHL